MSANKKVKGRVALRWVSRKEV